MLCEQGFFGTGALQVVFMLVDLNTEHVCNLCYLSGHIGAKSDDSAHNITNPVGSLVFVLHD